MSEKAVTTSKLVEMKQKGVKIAALTAYDAPTAALVNEAGADVVLVGDSVGMVKLVCFDDRPDSPTRGAIQEVHLGELNYALVTIPTLIWNGFKGEGTVPALVANCATIPHDPEEIERRDPFAAEIPYDWSLHHG